MCSSCGCRSENPRTNKPVEKAKKEKKAPAKKK
jgi:hypothetical protein